MSTNVDPIQTPQDKTPSVSPGNYSPVTVTMEDTVGATFLGILAVILLIGWRRAESRNRRLVKQLRTDANHSLNPQ
ncbi:MAG: hypothetical protein ABI621_05895 [Chloroflexota bacterium]